MSITVEKKKLKKGRTALYLSYYIQGKRWRESLRMILETPSTPEIRQLNKEKIQIAYAIRSKRELELISRNYDLSYIRPADKIDWWKIFQQYTTSYKGKDINTVKAMYGHLKNYVGEKPILTMNLTKSFCQGFYDFLRARLNGNTPTNYFKKFKQCLDYGIEQRIFTVNPAINIRCMHHNEFSKDILSSQEINLLAATPCKHKELKRAFLFSCFTGLRWCDIVCLRGHSIDYSHRMIHLVQQKVRSHSSKAILHLVLNQTAIRLLSMHTCQVNELVFSLPSYSYANRVLKLWAKSAGLTKHITFHCARHSFITNLLIYGANIKTASELAGHSTIRHTEKYIHIIDDLKRQAVDNLPSINIEI